jgi:hypothetical protein
MVPIKWQTDNSKFKVPETSIHNVGFDIRPPSCSVLVVDPFYETVRSVPIPMYNVSDTIMMPDEDDIWKLMGDIYPYANVHNRGDCKVAQSIDGAINVVVFYVDFRDKCIPNDPQFSLFNHQFTPLS